MAVSRRYLRNVCRIVFILELHTCIPLGGGGVVCLLGVMTFDLLCDLHLSAKVTLFISIICVISGKLCQIAKPLQFIMFKAKCSVLQRDMPNYK